MTIARLCDGYLDVARLRLSVESFKRRAWFLGRYSRRFGEVPLGEVDVGHFERWLAEQSTWGPAMRARIVESVKVAWNWAVACGLSASNPYRRVRMPRVCRRLPAKSDAPFRALLRAAPPHLRRLLLFLRWSGCRPCEARDLEWCSVDLANRVIVLVEHKTATTRRDGAPRVVPLSDRECRLLRWLFQHARRACVFTNAHGGHWTRDALCRAIARARRRARLPDAITAYGLRHMFATEAVRGGASIYEVQQLLGHATPHMAAWYVHLAGDVEWLRSVKEKAVGRVSRRDA